MQDGHHRSCTTAGARGLVRATKTSSRSSCARRTCDTHRSAGRAVVDVGGRLYKLHPTVPAKREGHSRPNGRDLEELPEQLRLVRVEARKQRERAFELRAWSDELRANVLDLGSEVALDLVQRQASVVVDDDALT